MKYLLLTFLLLGCAGESDDTPDQPPLKCTSSVLETDDGTRLLIECNRDVPEPLPADSYCDHEQTGLYVCNIFHASDADCKAFPGICNPH